MTTIAYDGKTLCADSQVTSRDVRFGVATKLWRLESGALLATTGDLALCYALMLWLDGKDDKPTPKEGESAGALLIEPDGTAWDYGTSLRRFPASIPWAGGTGEVIAMTAMRCGKTAKEAVEIACEMDIYTSGPVQVASLAPEHED